MRIENTAVSQKNEFLYLKSRKLSTDVCVYVHIQLDYNTIQANK